MTRAKDLILTVDQVKSHIEAGYYCYDTDGNYVKYHVLIDRLKDYPDNYIFHCRIATNFLVIIGI